MKQTILLIMGFLPLLISCKSTHYTPKTYEGRQLTAGSLGGVTGMMKEYVLFDNGQLFVSNGIRGEWRERQSLKRAKTKEIFQKAEELKLEDIQFNHPGNMTYYLILKDKHESHAIKWGESGLTPPEGITEFYQFLMTNF